MSFAMQFRLLGLSILLLSTLATHAQSARQNSTKLQSILDTLFNRNDPFNGVILIANKGQIKVEQAFGFRDFETRKRLKARDIFELASVSKQFTAYVIMMLEQQGKLEYDDLVDKYMSIPYKGISIRHLLNHTSGLPDYQAIMDTYWDKTRIADNGIIIDYLIRYAPPALFMPGEKYEYSNTGYVLLASIAEKASGRDFTEMLRTEVFQRLGMKTTDLRTPAEKKLLTNLSFGHIKGESGRYIKADSFPSSNYTIWLGNREGPGRISSTARDLLKWDRALYDTSFMSKQMKREGFKPAVLNNGALSMYGFGWDLGKDEKLGLYVEHNGDNPGYKTHILRFIEEDKTIIILCNNAHERFERLLETLKGAMLKF
jgi:CubicO group peptidase (beta-lactamase class C family)